MTELKQKAIDFIRKIKRIPMDRSDNQMELFYEEELDLMIGFATENDVVWHNIKENPTDVPKGENIHRKILLQDRYGYIYTGNYYPKDACHPEDCFAVEFLEWGFQGSNFVAFEQIAKWAEFKE